jgi:prepilin-type N-terminal cleavage/methylation domain-containing protein
MSQRRSRRPFRFDRRSAQRDAGVTLPELLVAVVVSGILTMAISSAFLIVLRTQESSGDRLAESRDITFVQTWLPVDLSSAISTHDSPDDALILTELAAGSPPLSYNAVLPGTNVVTVVRPDLSSGSSAYYVVAYRYLERDGDWQIARYEIYDPGTASETVKTVGVAHEVPDPPANWTPDQVPTHAAEVRSRNQVILRPIGEDIDVKFDSGNEFTTGGAGLSAEYYLPTTYEGGFTDPSAPPSRCGGRVALVIDTSGSVPANNGGIPTEQASVGFLDAFTGTPSEISINGFDREGYGMINDPALTGIDRMVSNGQRADFHSVLNTGDPNLDTMIDRITRLDDLDGAWPGGGAPIEQRDPNGDRAMWDQVGSGTNWEDGLYNVFFDGAGNPYVGDQPDLVVFITDGQPNRIRTSSGGSTGASERDATDKAAAIADLGRSLGARVIGVMVGNKANNSTYTGYLKDVVGALEWNGSVTLDGSGNVIDIDVGNAVTADFFSGSFAELGGVLRAIMVAECGGTLTVQKRINEQPIGDWSNLINPTTGVWSYTTDNGVRELDRAVTSSITFDYIFDGTTYRDVQITEQPVAGYVWEGAKCTSGGVDVPSTPNADGSPGVTVQVEPDKAVSCLMISRPAP